jgi:signal transduction histidine kinase/CheY-like chemotaxis protein
MQLGKKIRSKKNFIAILIIGIIASCTLLSYYISLYKEEIEEEHIKGPVGHSFISTESIGDIFISIAYFSIPMEIAFYYRRYPLPQYAWVFVLFIAFITLCGLTHLFHVFFQATTLTVITKLVTAIVSCVTAIYLFKFIPAALALQKYTFQLEEEIEERVQLSEFLRDTIRRGESLTHLVNVVRGIKDPNSVLAMGATLLQKTFQLNGCVILSARGEGQEEYALEVAKVAYSPLVSSDQLLHRVMRIIPTLGHNDERIAQFIADPDVYGKAAKSTSFAKDFYSRLSNNHSVIGLDELPDSPLPYGLAKPSANPYSLGDGHLISHWEPALQHSGIALLTRINILLPDQSKALIILIDLSPHKEEKQARFFNPEQIELLEMMSDQIEIALLQADYLARNQELLFQYSIKNEELIKAREIAEGATKAKSEFIAVVSHEIRTPMYAVCALTDLLQMESSLTCKQREMVAGIQAGSQLLLALVNDILDFSKYEHGDFELELIPFHLRRNIEQSIDMVANRLVDKRVEIGYVFQQPVPELLVGDMIRIRQIIVNLLSNATKFTHSGEIMVLVSCEERCNPLRLHDDKQVRVEVQVKDTGIGIAAEKIPSLFRMFSQVDSSTTREYGGTGLGLVICKLLVQKMGGEISVQSEVGKGSTFQFHVYLALPSASDLVRVTEDYERLYCPASDLHQKVVLVTSDPQSIVTCSLVEMLHSSHLIPVLCSLQSVQRFYSSGEDLPHLSPPLLFPSDLNKEDVIAIFVDYDSQIKHNNPEGRLQVLHSIEYLTSHLPVIALTKWQKETFFSSEPFSPSGFSSDSFNYYVLSKPLRLHALLEALDQIQCAAHPAPFLIERGPQVHTIPSPSDSSSDQSLRPLGLRLLVTEDNQLNQKVTVRIVEKLGCVADIACNGKVALEKIFGLPIPADSNNIGDINHNIGDISNIGDINNNIGDINNNIGDISYLRDSSNIGDMSKIGDRGEEVTGKSIVDPVTQKYDAILMDVNMPVLDGISATREICRRAKSLNCPVPYIIGTTAAGKQEEEMRCLHAGMRDFLRKPVTILDLYRALSKISRSQDLTG